MVAFKGWAWMCDLARGEDAAATAERRAALNARDRSLMDRFLARDEAAEAEVVGRLDALGQRVAMRFWPRLFLEWADFRGAYFETLGRYRDEGLLRLDEPLPFLAQRLLKYAGRKAGIEAHRDQMLLSFSGGWGNDGRPDEEADAAWARWLELQVMASVAAQPRFGSPEAALAAKSELVWLERAKAKLSPLERETFEAEQRVARGEHASLAEALGVSEAAARQRRCRLRKTLRGLAKKDGATEILERLEARLQRRQDQ